MKNCQRRRACVFTQIHSQTLILTLALNRTHSYATVPIVQGGGSGLVVQYAMHHSQIHIYSHTHTLTRTHSVCLCPIWYPLKRFTCPSAPCPAICNLHAKCIGWVHGWVCECAIECVGECIVNRSVYRCAFDLQFVSLASFLALSSDSFYVRFGHSCNFNLPEVVRRGYSHS